MKTIAIILALTICNAGQGAQVRAMKEDTTHSQGITQ